VEEAPARRAPVGPTREQARPSMPQTETSLDLLMSRLADGDRRVFSEVFALIWNPVLRLCRNLLKNDADAADAAQEALQKILQRAADYDRTRAALPWALAIAAWECRTLLRKRSRRGEVSDERLPEFSGEHPEAKLIERDLVGAALTAVGELSETDREVLMATFGEECASVTGATLRKRRERALSRLRDRFRRLYGLD
jgi:RNA polymerase sigma-70 factor, ECF subfamily